MLLQMRVFGLTVDPVTNSPIVILKAMDGDDALPIWIGVMEATAIASELEEIKFSRPMTHDLLKNILDTIGAKVERIVVCDLRENTYYALIYLTVGERKYEIDARPSDAIALALRVKAPIFVDEKVLEKSRQAYQVQEGVESEEAKKWTELLENLSPDDFGKYKM
ncbi:MAG: bifunctional nuclease family protein [Candidatus Desulfofervidus auxilii]|nr:bifunctional nuclease family protein [Candidatus Desulfofervidus auxilii]